MIWEGDTIKVQVRMGLQGYHTVSNSTVLCRQDRNFLRSVPVVDAYIARPNLEDLYHQLLHPVPLPDAPDQDIHSLNNNIFHAPRKDQGV